MRELLVGEVFHQGGLGLERLQSPLVIEVKATRKTMPLWGFVGVGNMQDIRNS